MNFNTFSFMILAIQPFTIVLLIVLAVLIIGLFFLYRFASKMQKKSETNQAEMKANSQVVSLLAIDKKRLKLKEAGLPSIVLEQTPKYLRRSKLPIVKVKMGPKVLNMISDDKIFESIPLKKEIKATISGIYIMDIKGLRSSIETKPKKMGMFKKMKHKLTGK